MKTIDIDLIRKTVPSDATITVITRPKPAIRVSLNRLALIGEVDEMKKKQREIVGEENIDHLFTVEVHGYWLIYLKRQPYTFLNC